MKVLILAGGFGSRLSEETELKPKPMVEIGGYPIIWHIMKTYSAYGFNEFVILLGYKGYVIKEYFNNYYLHQSDMTIDLKQNTMEIHNNKTEPWHVTLIDTGENSMTGGRIKRAQDFIGNEPFLLTYGDGVSDVNIAQAIEFHNTKEALITMTAIQPPGRYGALDINENNAINEFMEKPKGDGSWMNGGFFVCQPDVFSYIDGDDTIFEQEPLSNLATEGHLYAFQHDGFWACMDTLRDKRMLCELWDSKQAPWKVW
ncbi:MAG: glucose-1-phosphate cytidylyltransferase [Gammaproteobacteria bacterium]|mgnify:FL=1|nr:glucose-1-phosphate cytidylyltransferase [Gammaproteobacteria bacterium]